MARSRRPGARRGSPRRGRRLRARGVLRLAAGRPGRRGRCRAAAGPGADLDGSAGGRPVPGRGGANRSRPAQGAERLQPRSRPRGGEDRLARRAPRRPARRSTLVPPARLLRRVARLRRAGGRPVERLLVHAPRRRQRRLVAGGVRRLPDRLRVARRDPAGARRAGPGGALAEGGRGARPGDPGGARLRGRHGGDARGRRGRARRRLRRDGDGRAGVRGRARARARSRRHHGAAPARRPRRVGCSRTPAGCRAAPTAGSATSWDRRRRPGRRPPAPTSTSS